MHAVTNKEKRLHAFCLEIRSNMLEGLIRREWRNGIILLFQQDKNRIMMGKNIMFSFSFITLKLSFF